MSNQRLSIRYAQALLDLANEKNVLDHVKKDMDFLAKCLKENKELSLLFKSPVVNAGQKTAIFSALFKSNMNEISFSFISLIIKKRRESYVEEISLAFSSLYAEYNNIQQIILTVPNKITADLKEKIKQLVSKDIKGEVELIEKFDASLIGGFKIKIGDNLFDNSISTKIRKVKNKLIQSKI